MTNMDNSSNGTQKVDGTTGSPVQGSYDANAVKAPPQGTSADAQTYLRTFKTREDAEVGYTEAQRKISEQGSEVSRLKHELELAKQQSQITQLAEFLASKEKASKQQDSQLSHQEQLKKLIADFEENGAEPLVSAFDSSIYETNRSIEAVRAEAEKKIAETQASFKAELDRFKLLSSPDYQKHAKVVSELKEKFSDLSEATLLELAKEMSAKNESGGYPPGAGGGYGYTGPNSAPQGLSDEYKSKMKAMGLSAEAIANADEKEKQRNKEKLNAA